jgi:hypothetical protein
MNAGVISGTLTSCFHHNHIIPQIIIAAGQQRVPSELFEGRASLNFSRTSNFGPQGRFNDCYDCKSDQSYVECFSSVDFIAQSRPFFMDE